MMQLYLTRQEEDLLLNILEAEFKDLRNEISNTENWQYKLGLKTKEELLRKVLAHFKRAEEISCPAKL
jgi:hypothetical protein